MREDLCDNPPFFQSSRAPEYGFVLFCSGGLNDVGQDMTSPKLAQEEQAPQRDTLFLSHANPEDNEFTLWLALQLANEGYRVWCDLTKLLGGEVFWDNIEEAIKTRAVKVLYVLSRVSNAKDGPLKELHFAQGIAKKEKLKDFVIPLHIDDLPHGD